MTATTRNLGPIQTFVAGGTIPANTLVKLHSTQGQVVVTTAITDTPVGVAQNTCASGDNCEVATMNGAVLPMTAKAAISLGALVMPDSGGGGLIATAAGATAKDCGVAVMAALAENDVIPVLFRPTLRSPVNT